MAIVYRHRRLDTNEIFYIGIGKTEKRAYIKNQRNNWWTKIINKTDYEVEIIARDLSNEDAYELEMFLIKLYGRRDLGLGTLINLTDGGEGFKNLVFTEEHKNKISLALTGIKRSEEFKRKVSKNKKGKKIFTEERKKIYSENFSGVKNPMYGKSVMLGKHHSESSKEKIRIAHLGKTKMTNEGKKNLSEYRKSKGHICIDLETGIFYDTIKQLSIAKNIPYTTLKQSLKNNKNKTLKLI